jgi:hypothetical protein
MTSDPVAINPESDIARDMAKRLGMASPVVLIVSGLIWGASGVSSSAFALGLVALNFLAAAGLMTWGAKISPEALMGAVMFGYILRLAVITVAVLLVKDLSWVEIVPLGLTLAVAHLGVLIWETRYVSGSLAYPGLKPAPKKSPFASDQEADRP